MMQILILVGALVALKLLSPVLRLLIAGVAGNAVGNSALAKLPDEIHLEQVDGNVWKDRAAIGAIAGGLRPIGFVDAGSYTIPEMPGVGVRLLVNTTECFYAAVYEHPQAGVWYDLVTRYLDGTSITFSSAKPSGLADRPGHTVVNLKKMSVAEAFAKAKQDRPQAAYAPHQADRAVKDFQTGYAESIAWRKTHGVSRQEVMNVAMKKAA